MKLASIYLLFTLIIIVVSVSLNDGSDDKGSQLVKRRAELDPINAFEHLDPPGVSRLKRSHHTKKSRKRKNKGKNRRRKSKSKRKRCRNKKGKNSGNELGLTSKKIR